MADAPSNPVPRAHERFAAIAFVAIMALGLWQVFAAFARIDQKEIPATLTDFREGRTTGALQAKLEEAFPWREGMIATSNGLRYLLAHGSVERVRVGRNGWLFLGEELRIPEEAAAWSRDRIALVAEARRALDERGVKLVVALVPDKARLYSSLVPASDVPPTHAARYRDALLALRTRSIPVVDLLTPLSAAAKEGEVYYRTDTHWNQRGAQVAAKSIAEVVRARAGDLPATQFRSQVGDEAEGPGDLVRLMGLASAPRWLRPAPDIERPVKTEAIDAGGSLLGDFEIPVALVGTSYSMRANFHGFLQEALGARVLNAARDGSGFFQSANDYFANEAFTATPPRVVIWEIPERVLSDKPAESTSRSPVFGSGRATP